MTALPSTTQRQTEATAREWFVRVLDEDVGPDELMALQHWLDADVAHRAAYQSAVEAWTQMLEAPDIHSPTAEDLAKDRYDARLPISRWRDAWRVRPRLVSALAACVAVVAVAAAFWSVTHVVAPQQYATQRARQLEARLQDGSSIRLGGMTTLKVAFSPGHRDVGMAKGEALFKVAHDRARPFIVHTPLAAITAVGTAFDVDVGSTGVILTVTDGVVSVVPGGNEDLGSPDPTAGAPINVAKGQRLRMERRGARLILALDEGASEPPWMDGRLEYRNATLQSVVDDVNRYTQQPIIIADPEVASLQYTGSVQLQSVQSWVLGLPAAFPLTVSLDDRGQLILQREKTGASLQMTAPQSRLGV